MNSQICDFGDEPKKSKDAAAFDEWKAELEQHSHDIAARQRALSEPVHKVVVATPSAMHHKNALGAVMVAAGFQAADADALAGLLQSPVARLRDGLASSAIDDLDRTAAQALADLLDVSARELEAKGLYASWERRFRLYSEDRAEWLKRDLEFRLEGSWRQAPMTSGQRWLIRVTCRVLRLPMPGHLLRGQAADWLECHGANLNYGDFV
ncbi:hypothetical protein [Erythrobacter sp. R86502]|uniref:hypothetical protein n=1 Tax=Erythrobacter sp. R86502 TaxID=3093846 RepID=UPI0036D24E8E